MKKIILPALIAVTTFFNARKTKLHPAVAAMAMAQKQMYLPA